jgi:hypothetical protein
MTSARQMFIKSSLRQSGVHFTRRPRKHGVLRCL